MSVSSVLLVVLIVIILLWTFARLFLRGEDLRRYGSAPGTLMRPLDTKPSDGHFEMLEKLKDMTSQQIKGPAKERIKTIRLMAEQWSDGVSLDGLRIEAVDVDSIPAEWVMAEDADPHRRLLYIHGGAFYLGSPTSHSAITTRLAKSQRTSVLAIDYRLLPEHKRLDCLADCQTAYRWILDNGPQGPAPIDTFFVAGDSAGGNLALAVTAWARDEGLKPTNGCIALSPATDGTISGPSLRANMQTDVLLEPLLGKLVAVPNWIILLLSFFMTRQRPSDPRLSPIHDDLSNLPPTLVHASAAEMLLDDSRRYVAKATKSGSHVSLQIWPHMIHVWHIFHHKIPEGEEAFQQIEKFMALNGCRP